MKLIQAVLILIAAVAVLYIVLTYNSAEPVVVIEEATGQTAAKEEPVEQAAPEEPPEKAAVQCSKISPAGAICYTGTAEENNNFKLFRSFHVARESCSSHKIYPFNDDKGPVNIKLKLTSSADLNAYLTDNNETAWDRCENERPLRYVEFFHMEHPVEAELAVYLGYYLLFNTEIDKGVDVEIEADYSSNIGLPCSCGD